MNLSVRTRRLILHDLGVFVAAFIATGVLSSESLTRDAVVAAAVAAAKVTLRTLLPVPSADAN